MKQFLKMTLATICGIVILSLITGLFFVISLVGMVASDSAATKVKENSVFVLKLSGSVNERSEEGTPFDDFLGLGDTGSMGLDDLIASIRKAKDILSSRDDVSITNLAIDLGFASSQHFAARFRRETGMTPSEWRSAHR